MKLAVLARVDYLHFTLDLPALIAEKPIFDLGGMLDSSE